MSFGDLGFGLVLGLKTEAPWALVIFFQGWNFHRLNDLLKKEWVQHHIAHHSPM